MLHSLDIAESILTLASLRNHSDAGRHLFLDAFVHLVVQLLLPDEHGDRRDDPEETDGGLEGPEAALLNPRNDAAAVVGGGKEKIGEKSFRNLYKNQELHGHDHWSRVTTLTLGSWSTMDNGILVANIQFMVGRDPMPYCFCLTYGI